jgi:GNAT superfamily N-acetyltransferase
MEGVGAESVTVRAVDAGDVAAVVELIQQLGYERTAEEVLAWMGGDAVRQGEQVCLVACMEERVVGWIEASMERRLQTAPFALIGGLVVRDGFRGAGVGRRLCLEVERWAWAMGVAAVRVTSRSTREDAHRFYLRDGYRQVKMSAVFEKLLADGAKH